MSRYSAMLEHTYPGICLYQAMKEDSACSC